MIWFTADQHFGHENIIAYTQRPFKDIQHHDETLIKNFNDLVNDNDTCYHLGDVSLNRGKNIDKIENKIRRLNGKNILIYGNHEYLQPMDYIDIGFESAHTSLYLEDLDLHLIHDPAVANLLPNKVWLCGHVHNLFKDVKNVINVGVDVWDYKPVSYE